jgi:hypothetical protein
LSRDLFNTNSLCSVNTGRKPDTLQRVKI